MNLEHDASVRRDDGHMGRNARRIPHSALYTAATWRWGGFSCAGIVTPPGAHFLFHLVNAYVVLYRLINPRKHSLKHVLVHRHAIIDVLMARSTCRQIVEIAAGFSPRGCMASTDPDYRYFEVDLPEVTELKRVQMQSSVAGSEILARKNFRLFAADILHLDLFATFPAAPTFVISEGIMMYFRRETQMTIWRNIARFTAAHGGSYVFDYIPREDEPPRSRIGQWLSDLRHALTRRPPPFAYDERTRSEVVDDLRAAGFARVDVIDSASVAREWSLPHAGVGTHVLVFHCMQDAVAI